MQLQMPFLEADAPAPTPTTRVPTSPAATWEQIDASSRVAALGLLTRLIARMLAARSIDEVPHE